MKPKNAFYNLMATGKASLFLMLPFLILACAPHVKVSSDYDRSASFSSYKTFRLDHQTTIGMVNALNSDRIVNSIEAEMTKKGFTVTHNEPDLIIHAVTVLKDKHTVSVNSYAHGGVYRPYGFWPMSGTGHATVRKEDYKEGTLVIDIVDAKTKKMVWTGTANADIHKRPKNPDETIRAVVAKIMEPFPSRSNEGQNINEVVTGRHNKK